jgi:hypothetical protein
MQINQFKRPSYTSSLVRTTSWQDPCQIFPIKSVLNVEAFKVENQLGKVDRFVLTIRTIAWQVKPNRQTFPIKFVLYGEVFKVVKLLGNFKSFVQHATDHVK